MICECGEFIREDDYLCPVCHRDTLKELDELRVKCEKYREALESIAFLDEPLADTIEYWIEYWNLLDCGEFAETLCNDTYIAREALKDN